MQSPHLARFKFCRRCIAQGLPQTLHKTCLHHSAALRGPKDGTRNDNLHDAKGGDGHPNKAEPGRPMSRRLEEATEEALLSGGASGRRAIEDAGFSEELKEKLLDKVASARFQQQYKGAFAQAGISPSTSPPPAVQVHASHISSGNPWTGTEDTADAVLRMLHDAKKPLGPGDRGKFQPPVVDTRLRRRIPQSPGQRVGSARDKANMYVGMDMKAVKGLSDEEREEMKAERRERFQSAARAVPSTFSGIAALANQRIEDAIARGQFKDLPRGKEMERDPRANSPFIDTTEYLMNRMIQRQELVPPWIEKQQELTKAARVFRERLRNDWKRHASRMIASRGGSLEEQMRRAEVFAAAELAHNPRRSSDEENSPSILDLSDTSSPSLGAPKCASASTSPDAADSMTDGPVIRRPFRDPDWEIAEKAYMDLSIENLNSITRSYNLMAPELARKPYFSIDRELNSCFADVAPLIANEIKVRAVGRIRAGTVRSGESEDSKNLVERIFGKDNVKIHLEADEKVYGLKEWWRDLWKSG